MCKKKFVSLVVIGVLSFLVSSSPAAYAGWFGEDDALLAQILQQAVMQLQELRSILQTGSDTLGLLQDINRGINDSLTMAQTLGLRVDPGLYRELNGVDQAVAGVEQIFGKPVDSPLEPVEHDTDETVGEAISFNNELNDYTKRLDQVGEEIKQYSHSVSPGGAAKLTAESLGVMIHVLNQQIRATGQGLKLQAQALAMQNKHEKDQTAEYMNEADTLRAKMSGLNPTFDMPRF